MLLAVTSLYIQKWISPGLQVEWNYEKLLWSSSVTDYALLHKS